jgi:hypothetical protein
MEGVLVETIHKPFIKYFFKKPIIALESFVTLEI